MKTKILQQGAEAVISLEKNQILKNRISKSYRILEIDEKIRKLRTRNEAKLMEKASKEIPVPRILKADENKKEIFMEFIDGKKLSENLDNFLLKEQKDICTEIGKNIAKLHSLGIIHGDLTTSNMILKEKKIYFIDFGLSFHSHKYEDKAVDLHLIKQALEAKHFRHWESLYKELIKGYSKESKEEKLVLKQLEKVEKRGRYRH